MLPLGISPPHRAPTRAPTRAPARGAQPIPGMVRHTGDEPEAGPAAEVLALRGLWRILKALPAPFGFLRRGARPMSDLLSARRPAA
jgi:hypothetical protein